MQQMSPQQVAWMHSFFATGKGGGAGAASKTVASGRGNGAGPAAPASDGEPPTEQASVPLPPDQEKPMRTPKTLRAVLVLAALAIAAPALADPQVQLFKVVGPRDEVTIGLTTSELDAMGPGAGVERLARKLVADGQVTAWRYAVGRAPDGSTRYGASGKVAILRNDTLRIEPYAAALPVAPPPGG